MRASILLAALLGVSFLTGCATNPYARFYQSYTNQWPVALQQRLLPPSGEPRIIASADLRADGHHLQEQGYAPIGISAFSGGLVGEQQVMWQAKAVSADVVLYSTQFSHTEAGVMALPSYQAGQTYTTQTYGTANAYGSGGYAYGNYSGTSTTTTPGTFGTQYVPYLRNNPASPALQQYDHIVVDEYQDLNRAEQELIDVMAAGKNLSVVGDVDQSIYRFRYAHPEGITDFSNRHQNVEDHELDECRRCRELIVTLSDNVIVGNYPPGADHRLVPLQPQPGQPQLGPATVRVVQWPSLNAEADGIAAFIQHLVTQRGFTAGDILVLSPRRLIANEIKRRLAAPGFGITAHSFYNDKLFEPDEAQIAMTKLQLLHEPQDRVALRYWLGIGSNSWRQGQYSRLREYCEQNDRSPADVLGQVVAGQFQLAGINQLVIRYQELQTEVARLTQLSVVDLFNDLFPAGSAWAEPFNGLEGRCVNGHVLHPADEVQRISAMLALAETIPDILTDAYPELRRV